MDRANRRILIVASIAYFMTGLDASIVNIALPIMSIFFHVNTSHIAVIVQANLLAITNFVLVFGNLSDRFGPRLIFKWGLFSFAITSFLCGLSPDVDILIVLRFIQGIAEAMIISTCRAIIIKHCPEEARGKVYGTASMAGDIALAIGAPLGGLFVKYLSWKYIFFLNVPIGIIGFLVASMLLGDEKAPEPVYRKFDWRGALLSFFGITAFIYMLNLGDERGWTSPVTLGCLMFSSLFLILFVKWERKSRAPLLDLSMLKDFSFSLVLVCDLVVCMTYEGLTFLFPFLFAFAHNLSHDKIGLLMMIIPTLSMIMSPIAGWLSDKVGARSVSIGSLLIIISVCIMLYLMRMVHDIGYIVTSFVLFGIAIAIFFISNSCRQMKHAPPEKEGQAAALISFNSNLGSVLGICIFETIYSLNFAYHIRGQTHINLPADTHLAGFHDSCAFAAVICCIGLIAALIARDQRSRRHPEESEGVH